jgi:hypothetical protein
VTNWYSACTDELASAAWCVTKFASAACIKQRTGQLAEPHVSPMKFEERWSAAQQLKAA